MRVRLEQTTKVVELNGVPARMWEGVTDSGIRVSQPSRNAPSHCVSTW